ncbi:flagellar protein FliT [Piscibacillus halophilus]|uniref:flagellar protein FliT n=1 Tax=Piscibacillus halophilus TaxID=571933 RepID=UPI0024093046|nr:flagellar protein FliT [Piscibacillus halophilus]
MSAVKELYQATHQMVSQFKQAKQYSRDELVSIFEDFVSQRDQLMKNIQGPYTDEEKQLGKHIIKLDQELKVLANDYLGSIQRDISMVSKKKQSNKKYINPYANLYGTDGSFIDKKN